MPQISKQTPNGAAAKPLKGVLARIKPVQFDRSDGIKMILYGRSGTGKTTLWSTFPGPILGVICSGGKKSGELRSVDTPENRKKISYVNLEQSGELYEIAAHVGRGYFPTLVIDHVSGLQDLVLKEVLGLEEIPAQKSFGMASQQQYGQCTLLCKELLRSVLNLSCNVVLVAQERNFNDDGDDSVLLPSVGSAVSPSLAGWLHAAVDYIGQTYIRQKEVEVRTLIGKGDKAKTIVSRKKVPGTEYCLRTAPDAVYMTKFRVPRGTREIPEAIIDPSYDKIAKLING